MSTPDLQPTGIARRFASLPFISASIVSTLGLCFTAGTLLVGPSASVLAQPIPITPDAANPLPDTWGVITAERAILRPGPGYMYEVGELRQGDVVRILRTTVDGWTLISPPFGVKGFIAAQDVQVTDVQVEMGPDRTRRPVAVTLNKAKMTFSNQDDPIRSWKTWDAAPGTELIVHRRVPTASGDVLLVQMPPRAEVYAASRVVRPATPEEVRQWRAVNDLASRTTPPVDAGGDGAAAAQPPVTPPAGGAGDGPPRQPGNEGGGAGAAPGGATPSDGGARPTQPQPQPQPETPGGDRPPQGGQEPPTGQPQQPATTNPGAGVRLPVNDNQPPATPGGEGGNNATPQPGAGSEPGVTQPTMNARPRGTGDGATPAEGWNLIEAEVAEVTPAEADAMFSEMRQTPILDQEIVPLLTIYRRLAADETQSETDRRIADIRVNLLQLRLDVQQHARELRELQAQAEKTISEIEQERATAQAVGAFDIVGELTVSNLYNGARLPLLYRIEDPTSGRTLAYIAPSAENQAADMLGSVVGVIGAPRLNESLNIMVVDPKVIRPVR